MSVQGEVQLSRRLMIASDAVKDWTPAFEKSAEDLLEIIQYDVFETEGEAINERWQPLSPKYEKAKAKRYPDAGVLQATSTMRQSFMSRADSTSLTIWNAVEYFKYHQSNQQRRSSLPRRAMLKLTQAMREMVVKNFQVVFLENIGGRI
jgi:hypothetical protein